jgi:YidC/Oxa1 family membrane protein insertase
MPYKLRKAPKKDLYWVVNNILSIAQQWQINRVYGDGNKKPA